MTQHAPRRLLLVASDATSRGSAAPIRRYRIGRVLMDPQEMYGLKGERAPVAAEGRPPARGRA